MLVNAVGPGVALVYLAMAPYVPALGGPFFWDGVDIYVVTNPLLREPDGLYRAWFTAEPFDYYPLAYTTLWIEWQLFGSTARPYHITNLILHAGATVLVWRGLVRLECRWAWLVAAVFALHPLNVETVAWIAQRKSLLGATFGFAAIVAFLNYRVARTAGWWLLSVLCFALSLAGKPILIGLPLLLAGYVLWRDRRIDRDAAVRLAPYFVLAVLFGLVGMWFQEVRATAGMDVRGQDLLERAVTSARAVWFYLGKTIWPTGLSIVYPRWLTDTGTWVAYVPAAGGIAALGIAWRYRWSWGAGALAAACFYLVSLGPALGFVDVYFWRFSYVADHYHYQSMPAALVVLVAAGDRLVRSVPGRLNQAVARGPVARLMAAALLAVLFHLTWNQASLFAEPERLWRRAIALNDEDFVARINLGRPLVLRGDWKQACALSTHPTVLDSDHASGINNAGVCAMMAGDYGTAVRHFERAVRLEPDYPPYRTNLERARQVRRAAAHPPRPGEGPGAEPPTEPARVD